MATTSVETVLGPMPVDRLGPTLMHEHVFVNLKRELGTVGLLVDPRLMAEEISSFAAAGGGTIVDVTSAELTWGAAPDPAGIDDPGLGSRSAANARELQRLSAATGIAIVLGTGHYRDPYLDQRWFDEHDTDDIAERIVADLVEGVSGTEIRAGVIGEIGSDGWRVSTREERSFRAAARAARRTGVAISTHAAYWPVGIAQLELLMAEGVDPSRVVIGHCDTVNIPEYHEEIARRGAYVQFDTVQGVTDYDLRLRVGFVTGLRAKGHLDRILLSHDICRRDRLHIAGGCGYDFILTRFRDELLAAGVTAEEFDRMLVANPRRVLTPVS